MLYDPITLTEALIKCRSVTPKNDGAIELVSQWLEELNFECKILEFEGEDSSAVKNLWGQLGSQGPTLCFAGHTDVVPAGDESVWEFGPFEGKNTGERIFGRGASDMKGAIASFISATSRFLEKNSNFKGSLAFIITGDEEGSAINGTKKILSWMKDNSLSFDDCLVGEPTNPNKLGEMIKIGRRGSVNVNLTVEGTEGHVAYPHLADNPIPKLLRLLQALTSKPLDQGNENFPASNLEITSIDSNNSTTNVIPPYIQTKLNIRYNDIYTKNTIEKELEKRLDSLEIEYQIEYEHSGDSFITKHGDFVNNLSEIVEKHCEIKPELSTTGGTSDARFIKDYGRVVEFGLVGASMHKINENSLVSDIEKLTNIYLDVINKYFNQ